MTHSDAQKTTNRMEQQKPFTMGNLHWAHWLIVALSLLMTIAVWQYSKIQIQEKNENRFHREAEQVITLIIERLQKYEDALWSGVATIKSHEDTINFSQWQSFSSALHLPEKYKGINGIGVIFNVPDTALPDYLRRQQQDRPDYRIHPAHQNVYRFPITYIEPMADNLNAVGLDVAHESNRLKAALKARDSGQAQITAPIYLVQSEERTPGFLFYVPFYNSTNDSDSELIYEDGDLAIKKRQQQFAGMVYAPFIVYKLMQGTLEKARRHVGITISDDGFLLYDENHKNDKRYEKGPQFQQAFPLEVYGRNWLITIRSSSAFRNETSNNQPTFILVCGIIIDAMLFFLFIILSNANRRATKLANYMTEGYQAKSLELERNIERLKESNTELEQFAFAASHDLQEPLRTLTSFTELLKDELGSNPDKPHVIASIKYISEAAERMQCLVLGLMSYSRIGREPELMSVDCNDLLDDVLSDLSVVIKENNVKIVRATLPVILAFPTELRMLFLNLISNAIKFKNRETTPCITISSKEEDDHWLFSITDNGIGIDPKQFEHVFLIFKRLHSQDDYPGSGIGLSKCKKVVALHGGKIWVSSKINEGSTFFFTLAKSPKK